MGCFVSDTRCNRAVLCGLRRNHGLTAFSCSGSCLTETYRWKPEDNAKTVPKRSSRPSCDRLSRQAMNSAANRTAMLTFSGERPLGQMDIAPRPTVHDVRIGARNWKLEFPCRLGTTEGRCSLSEQNAPKRHVCGANNDQVAATPNKRRRIARSRSERPRGFSLREKAFRQDEERAGHNYGRRPCLRISRQSQPNHYSNWPGNRRTIWALFFSTSKMPISFPSSDDRTGAPCHKSRSPRKLLICQSSLSSCFSIE